MPDTAIPASAFIPRDAGTLDDLRRICTQATRAADYPNAAEVAQNVLIYDNDVVAGAGQGALVAEWVRALSSGPGIVAIRGAVPAAAVDRATGVFDAIIAEEKVRGSAGDHFAKPGANDRVWNALEKHGLRDPEGFAAYYGVPALDLISRAWLGDGYQMTAQVNRVNPGGTAQTAHRDYHLGFMSPERMEAFPAHVHLLSPMLTLQGAVAHVDMPLASGPTLYLPFSQQMREGYLAFGRPEFQDYFNANRVQLELRKGDAVFFNPAVMHGAGTNRTADIWRMANLLQVSSAMGRAMETVNRARLTVAVYPALAALAPEARARVIAASAEGYAFPTNLDRDPPIGGMAPKTLAAITAEAVAAGMPEAEFAKVVEGWEARRQS